MKFASVMALEAEDVSRKLGEAKNYFSRDLINKLKRFCREYTEPGFSEFLEKNEDVRNVLLAHGLIVRLKEDLETFAVGDRCVKEGDLDMYKVFEIKQTKIANELFVYIDGANNDKNKISNALPKTKAIKVNDPYCITRKEIENMFCNDKAYFDKMIWLWQKPSFKYDVIGKIKCKFCERVWTHKEASPYDPFFVRMENGKEIEATMIDTPIDRNGEIIPKVIMNFCDCGDLLYITVYPGKHKVPNRSNIVFEQAFGEYLDD